MIGLGEASLTDAIRAVVELALARLRLNSRSTRAMIAQPPAPDCRTTPAQTALAERVAYVVPRAAARLPWRTDCLVQALAAKRWLGRHGIDTQLVIGVRKPDPLDFEAHAWLKLGGKIIIGGDVSKFSPLTDRSLEQPNQTSFPTE